MEWRWLLASLVQILRIIVSIDCTIYIVVSSPGRVVWLFQATRINSRPIDWKWNNKPKKKKRGSRFSKSRTSAWKTLQRLVTADLRSASSSSDGSSSVLQAFHENERRQNKRHSRCSLLSLCAQLYYLSRGALQLSRSIMIGQSAACHDHGSSNSSHTTRTSIIFRSIANPIPRSRASSLDRVRSLVD